MQFVECDAECGLEFFKGIKGYVVEAVLPECVPNVLGRIHFRAVGWLTDEADILGDYQVIGSMPPGLIEEHYYKVFFEVFGYLLEKDVHHFCVGIWKDQRGHCAQGRGHGGVRIEILPYNLLGDFRTDAGRGPTGSGIAYESEASLILSHDENRSFVLGISRCQHLNYALRKFFLNSSCSASFACL